MRQVIFTITHADPQIFVKWPAPRSACNYPDRSVPRDCLRRYERYSVTNGISGNDFSEARKRNKPWPATTHICTLNHSVRQCKHASTGAECLACSSVTESVFHSYETDLWIYSKKLRNRLYYTRGESHTASIKWVSTCNEGRKWSIEYGCKCDSFTTLYMWKKINQSLHFEDNNIDGIIMLKSVLNK